MNLASALLVGRPSSPLARRRSRLAALILIIASAAILRAELALLAAPVALQCLFTGDVDLVRLLFAGSLTSIASAASTTLVDSYFWQKWPLWPELCSLYFNVYEGKSSEWGVRLADRSKFIWTLTR